jgi:hypothetical protein
MTDKLLQIWKLSYITFNMLTSYKSDSKFFIKYFLRILMYQYDSHNLDVTFENSQDTVNQVKHSVNPPQKPL